MPSVRRWHAPLALVHGAVQQDVLLEAQDGRFTAVTPGVADPPSDAERLGGLTLPGLANAHSHAFQRALRGRTESGRGSFWTWREQMYALARTLTPDTYLELARATFAEMALSGMTCVGEFHYVHHDPTGTPYRDPNEMGWVLVQAAADAGIRITLLDSCYLAGGFGEELTEAQRRFSDGSATAWASRLDGFPEPPTHARLGAAIHSVRAVPACEMAAVVSWARERGAPLHVHLSEQRAENEQCRRHQGRSPTQLLADQGVLGASTTVVHATHVTADDISLLGGAGVSVCLCPTTERELGDGLGPAGPLAESGCRLTVGSDGHFVIDGFEEARALELDERLRTGRRGHWSPAELLSAACAAGHRALGWDGAGMLAPGHLADLVTVGLHSPRVAGARPETALGAVVFGATAADVDRVVVAGADVVREGRHVRLGDAGTLLDRAVGRTWEAVR